MKSFLALLLLIGAMACLARVTLDNRRLLHLLNRRVELYLDHCD